MKLFVYDHCPYCVRARVIFALKNIPFELVILANDDDETPTKMIGQKMVPILQKEDGSYMPESLDIVNYIDQNCGEKSVLTGTQSTEIAAILGEIQAIDFTLVYPRFVKLGLAEFASQHAKDSFESRKRAKSGAFSECFAKTEQVARQVELLFAKLENTLKSTDACNGQLSVDDICLFPTLRNLTSVKGLHFPTKVKTYIESMAKQSQIDLYFDRAI